MARYVYNDGMLNEVDKKGNKISNNISTAPSGIKLPTAKSNNVLNYNINTRDSNNLINPQATINSIKKVNNDKYFKKSNALSDGYDFGDITKTTLSTIGDAGVNVVKGATNILEGATDLVTYTGAGIASLLGADDTAKKWKESAANNSWSNDLFEPITEKLDKNSILGNKSDAVAQGVGYYAGMVGLQALGVPWQLTAGVTSAGNSLSESFSEGASTGDAIKYALASTAAEIGSEYMFSGLGKLTGTGALDDVVINSITKRFKNQYIKTLADFGLKSAGEGIEEIASGWISEIAKQTTYMKEEDKNILQNAWQGTKDYFTQQAAADFWNGTLVSAISGIAMPGEGNLINNLRNTKNINTQQTNIIENNTIENQEQINSAETKISTENSKINNLRNTAIKYNINQDLVNVAEKIISDKNYNIVFDNTITNDNGNMINAQITALENGEIEIRLNPNSERAGEFLLVHEITHSIANDSMKQLVLDYANKNVEFNKALNELKQTYKTEDVTEEVLADISGQLFGNQEFINNLSVEQPSIFKQIYAKIIELVNKITGNTKEALFIRNLQDKWENAYRLQNNNLEDTKYMITGLKGVKNGIKADSDNQWALDSYNKAQEMLNKKYTNEEIRKKTNWFQDKQGKWKFEISDHNAILSNDIKKNTNCKLSDIFNHSELYEMYPKLKKIRIKFKNISNYNNEQVSGQYVPLTNTIEINNKMLEKNNANLVIKKTLLHEIQHYIQKIEHFDKGYTGNKTGEYFENIGEIEASNTANRVTLNEVERMINAPETSKEIPIHPTIQKILENPNSKQSQRLLENQDIANLVNKIYNEIGESNEKTNINNKKTNIKSNLVSKERQSINDRIGRKREIKYEISDSMDSNNLETTTRDSNNRSLRSKSRGREELDNSSFSNSNKYDNKWQEHLEKNYKATGTRTNMKNLVLPKVNGVKQNNNTNKNTQIRQSKGKVEVKNRSWVETVQESKLDKEVILEAMKDYDYSYIPDSNKKQWNRATESFNKNGYEASVKNIISNFEMGNKFTADDLVLAQKLMQEASSIKDVDTFRELLPVVSTVGTELGQAVQSLSVIKKLSPEGQLLCLERTIQYMNKNVKGAENVKITNEMAQKILDSKNSDDLLNNMDEVKKQIAKQLPTTLEDKLTAWRYLSMLGSLRTHVRNIVSNFAMKETADIKNSIARCIETILDKKIKSQGLERTKTFEKPSQVVKEFANSYTKDSSDTLKNTSKYTLELEMKKAQKIFGEKGIGGFVQKLYDANSTALEFEDSVFRNSAFKKSLAEYLTANNIKTQQDIDNNPKLVNNAVQYATEESLKATFQQFNALSSALNSLRNKGSGYKFVIDALVPFKKTPANILSTGVSYSPLGLAKSIFHDTNQLRNGNITTTQYIDNISKGLTGTGIMFLGLLLAELGILSSGGSDDKEDEYDIALGKQEYAINIGNQSITLDWLSPVAMPLFVGAEISNMKNNGTNNAFNFDTVTSMLTSTFDPLMSMSLLQGLNNALSGYSDNKLMAVFEESLISYVGQFFPTIGGQIAKTIDPTIRSTSVSQDSGFTLGERILRTNMAKIPGLTYLLEPSLDIWGNEKRRSDNVITRAYENFIAPYNRKEMKTTEIDKELKDLYSRTGEDSIIPSTYIKKYIMFKEQKYETNSKTYTQYKKTYGEKASITLESLFKTNTYKEATDEDKIKMINRVYDYANDEAKKEFLETKGISYTNAKNNNIDIYKENVIIQAIEEDVSIDAINYKNQNPKKYNTMVSFDLSYDDYNKFSQEINSLKSQYDDTNSRKYAIWQYIQSQKITKVQKILLYNICGGYSISNYKDYMFNYINNQNMTKEEKQEIWQYLYE